MDSAVLKQTLLLRVRGWRHNRFLIYFSVIILLVFVDFVNMWVMILKGVNSFAEIYELNWIIDRLLYQPIVRDAYTLFYKKNNYKKQRAIHAFYFPPKAGKYINGFVCVSVRPSVCHKKDEALKQQSVRFFMS